VSCWLVNSIKQYKISPDRTGEIFVAEGKTVPKKRKFVKKSTKFLRLQLLINLCKFVDFYQVLPFQWLQLDNVSVLIV